MSDHETPQPPKLYDEVFEIYDPTGTLKEMPKDSNLMSWLKTAYLVHKAHIEDPANEYLLPGLQVIGDAIRQRNLELQHGTLYPRNEGLR